MKKTLLIAVLSLAGAFSYAQTLGGPVTHNLVCESPKSPSGDALLGVGYSMECTTQALAPQYSLRGCNLYSSPIRPNAPSTKIDLELLANQTAKRASLANKALDITVIVNKADLSASVNFRSGYASMKCVRSN